MRSIGEALEEHSRSTRGIFEEYQKSARRVLGKRQRSTRRELQDFGVLKQYKKSAETVFGKCCTNTRGALTSKRNTEGSWRSTRRVLKEFQSIAGTPGALELHSRSITAGFRRVLEGNLQSVRGMWTIGGAPEEY